MGQKTMSEETDVTDIKDVRENIKKFQGTNDLNQFNIDLVEILREMCDVISQNEAWAESQNNDLSEELMNQLRKHRHLSNGKVVSEI
jgi:hypothetical protein